jgi:hypothetical protein
VERGHRRRRRRQRQLAGRDDGCDHPARRRR